MAGDLSFLSTLFCIVLGLPMTQRGVTTQTVSQSLVSSLAPGAVIARSPRGNTILAPIKIAVLGFSKTGKSALSLAFVNRVWVPRYEASQEDVFIRELELDNVVDIIDILDSSAPENDYLDMCAEWFGRDAFIITYSVDSQKSYDFALSIWDALVALYNGKGMPVPPTVLFATKLDIPANNREVNLSVSKMQSAQKHLLGHFEGSAKEQSKAIDDAFGFLIRKVRETRKAQPTYNNLFKNAPAQEVHLKPNLGGSTITRPENVSPRNGTVAQRSPRSNTKSG